VAPSAQHRKVWLTPWLECRAVTLQIQESAKLGRKVNFAAGKIPLGTGAPKMYILCTSPGDGQTSCTVCLASSEQHPCSNEGKMRNPLKFAGVPQTTEPISAINGPMFAVL